MPFRLSLTLILNKMKAKDDIVPTSKWEFNENVASVFEDMLERSIPDYESMRLLMYRMAKNFITPFSNVLDIGCSTGLSSEYLIKNSGFDNVDYYLIDVSEPMLSRCSKMYDSYKNVSVDKWDITEGCPVFKCSVVICCLTLQFVPIEYRQKIISSIYDSLNKGGALFLVEKVIGNSHVIEKTMIQEYYEIKREHSYTEEQIENKRKSLAGTLVPLTYKMNESLLQVAGFTKIDTFWRYLNFCGIVAVK